jgi:hypothetical protein
VVWLTTDVHYTAAHYFDPDKAAFSDFDPFWQFTSGPLNAGAFPPDATDTTFGAQQVFVKAPAVANATTPAPSCGRPRSRPGNASGPGHIPGGNSRRQLTCSAWLRSMTR